MTPNDLNSAAALSDERVREIARQYCVYDKDSKQCDIRHYECEEDFLNFVRYLLAAAGKQADGRPLGLPDGWRVRNDSDAVVVEKDGLGGVLAEPEGRDIASSILYHFVVDLLGASQPATPEALPVKADSDVSGAQPAASVEHMAVPPRWYTEHEIRHCLKCMNYSEEIAIELSTWFVRHLQLAFNKGFEEGCRAALVKPADATQTHDQLAALDWAVREAAKDWRGIHWKDLMTLRRALISAAQPANGGDRG